MVAVADTVNQLLQQPRQSIPALLNTFTTTNARETGSKFSIEIQTAQRLGTIINTAATDALGGNAYQALHVPVNI
jgi:hypothetical protein